MAKIIEEMGFRNKDFVFKDRFHAGEILARKLNLHLHIDKSNSIILAIPSGGVPVGSMISKKLGIPMDVIIVRKIPVPFNTEAGFGSISSEGDIIVNRILVEHLHLRDTDIESSVQKVKSELDSRTAKFRGNRPFPELRNRTVILVDDGLASGYTMLAAIKSVKKQSPAGIVVAVPTASKSAITLVSPHCDEIFCLNIRETMMFAVADAYQEWHDLTDQEVMSIIREIFQ